MTLKSYIEAQPGRTHAEWAERFGVSRSHFTMLLSGAAYPSRKLMQRIAEATEGAVPVTSWFEAHD
jgi:transcriptional regulator with XRE-family HTH domain